MRIVGGQFRGKQLASPRSDAIRPSSDRLRETLFNILAHAYGDPVRDARVADLFAGTGALGLEALSRGARFVLFVDEGAEARGLIRSNIDGMGLGGRTRLFRRDATKLGAIGPTEPFSLVFLDPPYRKSLAEGALVSLRDGGWLAPGALLVVEEASPVEVPAGFESLEIREYGETSLTFLRAGAA
jgi:16S rRNA (guanine966-N2)-methyltransferase